MMRRRDIRIRKDANYNYIVYDDDIDCLIRMDGWMDGDDDGTRTHIIVSCALKRF
jgi:hypothetical protein